MSVERIPFGLMPDGRKVYKYIITNNNEYSVHILTLGATLNSFIAKDKNGENLDVLLGFDSVEDYLELSDYQGATVGPVANRIGGASFDIGAKHYELVANEKDVTCLHSGGEFSFALWNAVVVDSDAVEFGYTSPDGQGGFPGETSVKVIFSLKDDNKLTIKYEAVSDRDTFINLTNHAYFNLKGYGNGTILDHTMQINAEKYTPVDEMSIPYGRNDSVEGTPFDFRKPVMIGDRIDDDNEQLNFTGGFDHNFCVSGEIGELRPCAEAFCAESGIKMNVYTTLPGVQFYAGNFLNGTAGKKGVPMEKRSGFCLETQYYPDTPNKPDFPQCFFKAGEKYESETVYEFHTAGGSDNAQ